MAITGMPIGRGLPNLPVSQTRDIGDPGDSLDMNVPTMRMPGSTPGMQHGDVGALVRSILGILSHPVFKQLMQAGQPARPPLPERRDFHVPTGGVPIERYPLPQARPMRTEPGRGEP